jgi:hypothetical protein
VHAYASLSFTCSSSSSQPRLLHLPNKLYISSWLLFFIIGDFPRPTAYGERSCSIALPSYYAHAFPALHVHDGGSLKTRDLLVILYVLIPVRIFTFIRCRVTVTMLSGHSPSLHCSRITLSHCEPYCTPYCDNSIVLLVYSVLEAFRSSYISSLHLFLS